MSCRNSLSSDLGEVCDVLGTSLPCFVVLHIKFQMFFVLTKGQSTPNLKPTAKARSSPNIQLKEMCTDVYEEVVHRSKDPIATQSKRPACLVP